MAPMYDYQCPNCSQREEVLCRHGEERVVYCSCNGDADRRGVIEMTRMERLFPKPAPPVIHGYNNRNGYTNE